jgi:hypothetical protein
MFLDLPFEENIQTRHLLAGSKAVKPSLVQNISEP